MSDNFYEIVNTLFKECNSVESPIVRDHNDEIEFIKMLPLKFQLPLSAQYKNKGAEQKHAQNPYKEIFIKNPYYNLYKYLQTDSTFKDIQTKILKLHMGLFAYADNETRKLRYLYGPWEKAHFFIKAYWFEKKKTFKEEPSPRFSKLMRTFYYGRTETAQKHWRELDFVRFLENSDDKELDCRRTKFERSTGVIYAPSGEMDACILCWLFLSLENELRADILKEIDRKTWEKKFCFDLSYIKPTVSQSDIDQDISWHEKNNKTLYEWFKVLGLIEQHKRDSFTVAERGKHMVSWLETYLISLNRKIEILGKEETEFFKIINVISETIWLKDLQKETSSFLKITNEQEKFLAAVKLLLLWNEGEVLTREARGIQFQRRCRFNLYGHLILRAEAREGKFEKSARAWIVFPVLADEEPEKDGTGKLINVGFFLGTFKDSAYNGESYFANYKKYKTELTDIISKTKIIMNILASVENREIYYKEVQRMHIIKHGERAAIASIMGRNMSHNIGSHVLSEIKYDDLSNTSKFEHEFSTFHAYMQKRMDLIARITGKTPGWGEPMYFVGDLLRGFFNQSLLLNHLVEDQGKKWKEKGIEFKILLQINENGGSAKSTEVTFNYIETSTINKKGVPTYSWRPSDGSNFDDFLVSIPDGNIGAQAFYIFMESLMRNSAKYGEHKEDTKIFTININVTSATNEKGSYYRLKIFDNLSGCNGKLIKEIRDKIIEPLINENSGELAAKSLGIAEMREACNFLINQRSVDFPANKNIDDAINWKPYPLWAECKPNTEPSDNCISQCTGSDKFLSYTFNLLKSQMIGIVGDDTKTIKDNDQFGIKNISMDDLVKRTGAYQFAVIFMNDENKEGIIKLIEKDHQYLPQRLIIVNCTGSNSVDICPHNKRRAVICYRDNILPYDGDCESFILKVYETWIKKKWLDNEGVDLNIYFEHSGDIWKNLCEKVDLQSFNEGKLVLKVFKKNGISLAEIVKVPTNGKNISNNKMKTLFYDNHGEFLGYYRKKVENKTYLPDFHHEIGGRNKKIFETIESPPQNKFGFSYFILGLIEAGLAKVAIVDERVAINTGPYYDSTDGWQKTRLVAMHNIACYPLFRVLLEHKNKMKATKDFLTDAVEQQVKNYVHDNEGMILDEGNCWKISYIQGDKSNKSVNGDFFDLLIIHSGIIETKLTKDMKLNKQDDRLNKLYELVPSIIVTSGRGAVNKDLPFSDSPFVEFSMLKENLYPSISKYHLVRTLMSSKGNKE